MEKTLIEQLIDELSEEGAIEIDFEIGEIIEKYIKKEQELKQIK
jgi:hypothetical protein